MSSWRFYKVPGFIFKVNINNFTGDMLIPLSARWNANVATGGEQIFNKLLVTSL